MNGPTHIVFLLMEQKTGAKMWPLQLGGGGPAITNLLGSNTMAYAGDPSVVGEHILGGKLKGLCVTDTQRWASLPNVQTCREAGIDIVFHFWRGVLVPKGTPADRVAKLSEGFGKLVKDEGFLWLMKAIHSNIAYLDHTTFAEYLTGEQKQLKELYETMKK